MDKNVFRMPKPIKIMGRTSSITNAFVNGIIPCIEPSENEIKEALKILELDENDLRCSYCGDKSTEWDHLRPLVKNKRPTGYISEIHNLVPSCGKCNQSKGNKDWKAWMYGSAKLSPKTRNVADLDKKGEKLSNYEKWKTVKPIDFKKIVGEESWGKHWKNHEQILFLMAELQKHSDKIKEIILDHFKK